jgi:hypothetical protein
VDTECPFYSDLNLNQIIRERILKQNVRPTFHKSKQLRKARIYVKVHCYFKDFTVITADFELQLGYDLADQVRLGYSSEVFLLNHPIRKIKVDIESVVDEKVAEYAAVHLEGAVAHQSYRVTYHNNWTCIHFRRFFLRSLPNPQTFNQ